MKPEERANELYPNNSTFCGGVASIARQAYIKGWEEVERELLPMLKELTEAVLFGLFIGFILGITISIYG